MNYSTKIIKSEAKKKHCWPYNCRKIRTRKSSLLMFNFCEVFADHAMVTTKKEGTSENMGFRFQTEKRTETIISTFQKKPNGKQRTL